MIGNFIASPSAFWNCSSTSPTEAASTPAPVRRPSARCWDLHDQLLRLNSAPYVNCATVSLTVVGCDRTQSQQQFLLRACRNGTARRFEDHQEGPVKVPSSAGLSAFTLTVTNAGPPFYLSPNSIAVTDTATGLIGTFASISATPAASWNCSVSGNSGNLQLSKLWPGCNRSGAWHDHHHLPLSGARKFHKLREGGSHQQRSAAGTHADKQPSLRDRQRYQNQGG